VPVNIEIVKRVDPDKKQVSLLLHDTEVIELIATYPDGTEENVTDIAEWTSSDTAVVDVLKGAVTGYGPGTAAITAAYGTKSATIKVDVDNAIKLDVDKLSILMSKNTTEQVKLTATYAGGDTEDITARAEWTSSKDSVANVIKGKILANSSGEATITAQYGDKSVTIQVDVDVPRRLELNKDAVYLKTTQTEQLVLQATFADGSTEDVSGQAVWSVNNESIAMAVGGKLTAYKPGEAIVTAAFGGKSTTARIAVDVPNTITVSKKTVSFQVGQSEQLVLTANFEGGRQETVTDKAEWSSSAPLIAEARNGLITGVGTGSATVTAKYGTRSVTVQVSVGVLKSLTSETASSFPLKKGDSKSIAIAATYTDGTVKDATLDAAWSSSNTAVAAVDNGTVKALAAGKAAITAVFDGKPISFDIDVDMADDITATPAFLAFDLGETKTISLSAKDSNGDTRDVTSEAEWTSSNVAIAQVSALRWQEAK
jgi:uncharacterized protein YjdB